MLNFIAYYCPPALVLYPPNHYEETQTLSIHYNRLTLYYILYSSNQLVLDELARVTAMRISVLCVWLFAYGFLSRDRN